MAQPVPNPPPGFDALSTDEKLEYLEALWERVLEQSSVPIPDWQRELIEERLRAFAQDPTEGRPWRDVRTELERKFASR